MTVCSLMDELYHSENFIAAWEPIANIKTCDPRILVPETDDMAPEAASGRGPGAISNTRYQSNGDWNGNGRRAASRKRKHIDWDHHEGLQACGDKRWCSSKRQTAEARYEMWMEVTKVPKSCVST